jgi:hypothetical protein
MTFSVIASTNPMPPKPLYHPCAPASATVRSVMPLPPLLRPVSPHAASEMRVSSDKSESLCDERLEALILQGFVRTCGFVFVPVHLLR